MKGLACWKIQKENKIKSTSFKEGKARKQLVYLSIYYVQNTFTLSVYSHNFLLNWCFLCFMGDQFEAQRNLPTPHST